MQLVLVVCHHHPYPPAGIARFDDDGIADLCAQCRNLFNLVKGIDDRITEAGSGGNSGFFEYFSGLMLWLYSAHSGARWPDKSYTCNFARLGKVRVLGQ